MVEKTLTKEMIDSGENLIRKLDESGVQPDAAFWFYFPDTDEWKLVLAEVKVGRQGPKEVYRQIQEVLFKYSQQIGEVSLDNIALVKPDEPIVLLLGTAIRTGPGISGIRFKNNVINGMVIEDAYIYRLKSSAQQGQGPRQTA